MTNADGIRNMTDEQLANFLATFGFDWIITGDYDNDYNAILTMLKKDKNDDDLYAVNMG